MKKKQDVFNTISWLVPICEKITHHRFKKFVGCDNSYIRGNYKYANRHDFYYKCRICGEVYFNHKINEKDLAELKKWVDENKEKVERFW